MKYIVLDLEWNQCPFGKEKENKDLPFEIIEIGAVRLDASLSEEDIFEAVIRPKVYQQMHYMAREVTKIKKKDLKHGHPFPEVMKDFLRWCGETPVFCTWGPLDLWELQRNMQFYHMKEFPHPLYYLDIQKLFSIQYEDGKLRRSLKCAADFLKIKAEIPYHRAYADAYYTAEVMKKMDFKQVKKWISVDYFHPPHSRKEEIHLVFDTYYKYVSRTFSTKEDARKDREVVSTKCYCCHKSARKVMRWYSDNGKIYYSLSYCNEHGYIKGKMRMKKTDNGRYFVVKTLKLVSPEIAMDLREKKEEMARKRKEKSGKESKRGNNKKSI